MTGEKEGYNLQVLREAVKSLELKDVILAKLSVFSREQAMGLVEVLRRPVILVDEFDDFSSISKEELKRIIEMVK